MPSFIYVQASLIFLYIYGGHHNTVAVVFLSLYCTALCSHIHDSSQFTEIMLLVYKASPSYLIISRMFGSPEWQSAI